MKNITTVLFDVDGTLLDTAEYIYQAFEHTFKTHGISNISRKDLAPLMGKPAEECYEIITPGYDFKLLCDTHRLFQENNLQLVKLFPNTLSTITTLRERGKKLVAISTRKRTTLTTLERSGLLELLDGIITGDDVTKFKPDPEGLLLGLKKAATPPQEAIMVGDTQFDIAAGKNAGTFTAAALYGLGSRESLEKEQPDFLLHDIQEILSIVE